MTINLPPGSEQTQGRHRMLVVRTQVDGGQTRAMLVIADPQGEVIYQGQVNSGGARTSRGALPGLNLSPEGRAIIAEYPVGNRRDRNDPGFTYSNGSTGFTYDLLNAPNLDEIGGAGRDHFRIHSGGLNPENHGCLEFVDAQGRSNAESDRSAREFDRIMRQLQATDTAPVVAEIVNPSLAAGLQALINPAVAAAGTQPQAQTQTPPSSQDEEERRDRIRREVEGQSTGVLGSLSGFAQTIMNAIQGFFQFLLDALTGDTPNGGDGDQQQREDPTAPRDSSGTSLFNNIRTSGAAAATWASYQREHGNERVVHRSPVAGAHTVGDDRHMRERHPIHGDRRMHHGIDIPGGGNILASADGVVLYSGWIGGYGNTVIVGHADGTYSLYGHLASRSATVGSEVRGGQNIGVMGETGGATGVHLHYEQRRGRDSIVPVIEGEQARRGMSLDGTSVPSLTRVGVSGGEHVHENRGPGPMRNAVNGLGAALAHI